MDDPNGNDSSGHDFSATTPLIRPEASMGRVSTSPKPQPVQKPPTGPPKSRGIPIWVWLIGAGLLMFGVVLIGVILWWVIGHRGFTIIVKGAPPGSDVLVDGVSHGVTSADGTIRVTGLKAGKRVVKVTHEGCSGDPQSVTGENGDIKPVIVQLNCDSQLPKEIEYSGAMILINKGEFLMGDDSHNPNEKPAHKVTLPDFYIDKFEVSNEQYKKFCDATKHAFPTSPWWDPAYAKKPRMPVVGVNYGDAVAYAEWAHKRLPTEEEWEKAASWGPSAKKRMWPWGDSANASQAILGTNHSANVGSKPSGASEYGVQDMAGNVFEWVDAFYQAYPNNSGSDPNFGTNYRVVRGGSFRQDIQGARTTERVYQSTEFTAEEKKERSWLIGFRCAVSASDANLQAHLRPQK